MRRILPLLALTSLLGCAHVPAVVAPDPLPQQVEPVEHPQQAGATRCKKLDRKVLHQLAPPQGNLLQCFSVAKARGEVIDVLNLRLAAIAAAIEQGCVE